MTENIPLCNIVEQKKQNTIYVVGHQNPDTDSAVSAVVYAQLCNQLTRSDRYEGVVLGPLNQQSAWLFHESSEPAPRIIEDVYPRVRDLTTTDVPSVRSDSPLGEAVTILARNICSTVPVLDSQEKLEGILSDRIAECNHFHQFNTEEFLGILFSLEDLVRTFQLETWQEGKLETNAADGKLTLDSETVGAGDVLISGMAPERFAEAARRNAAAVIACTTGPRSDWQETLEQFPEIGVYRFTGSLMALTSQLPHCIPARNAMASKFICLHPDQPLRDVKSQIRSTSYALPVVASDGRFVGVISRGELLSEEKPQVVLVDHFERHQSVPGLEEVEITEIVDHHRVGDLETLSPIRVECRPVGSTATIVAQKFRENQLRPTANQAKLLLGAVISDTLALTSPTTTSTDQEIGTWLAELAGVELDSFARAVLTQADATATRSATELVNQDLKEFGVGKTRFSISQIETVDRTKIDNAKLTEFQEALVTVREQRQLDFASLLITDVLQKDSLVLFSDTNPQRTAQLIGAPNTSQQLLPGIVSRKKQFLPLILARLQGD